MNATITLKVFANNRVARQIVSRALRELRVDVVAYVSRRAQMNVGTPRYDATPYYIVNVATRYEGRAIKLRCDAIAAELTTHDNARHCGALVSGIPHDSPAA